MRAAPCRPPPPPVEGMLSTHSHGRLHRYSIIVWGVWGRRMQAGSARARDPGPKVTRPTAFKIKLVWLTGLISLSAPRQRPGRAIKAQGVCRAAKRIPGSRPARQLLLVHGLARPFRLLNFFPGPSICTSSPSHTCTCQSTCRGCIHRQATRPLLPWSCIPTTPPVSSTNRTFVLELSA